MALPRPLTVRVAAVLLMPTVHRSSPGMVISSDQGSGQARSMSHCTAGTVVAELK
jgi:hypothetical protein